MCIHFLRHFLLGERKREKGNMTTQNMIFCRNCFSAICHHHHVVVLARISLTLSRHFSLSFIASGRSSGLHPISSHSYWMYVWAGHPAFAWPYVGVHRSTSLMSSSLLLQQWPACLVIGPFFFFLKSQVKVSIHFLRRSLSLSLSIYLSVYIYIVF